MCEIDFQTYGQHASTCQNRTNTHLERNLSSLPLTLLPRRSRTLSVNGCERKGVRNDGKSEVREQIREAHPTQVSEFMFVRMKRIWNKRPSTNLRSIFICARYENILL